MRDIIFIIISIILALITIGGMALLIVYGSIELFVIIFVIVLGIIAVITLASIFYNLINNLVHWYELELEKKEKRGRK